MHGVAWGQPRDSAAATGWSSEWTPQTGREVLSIGQVTWQTLLNLKMWLKSFGEETVVIVLVHFRASTSSFVVLASLKNFRTSKLEHLPISFCTVTSLLSHNASCFCSMESLLLLMLHLLPLTIRGLWPWFYLSSQEVSANAQAGVTMSIPRPTTLSHIASLKRNVLVTRAAPGRGSGRKGVHLFCVSVWVPEFLLWLLSGQLQWRRSSFLAIKDYHYHASFLLLFSKIGNYIVQPSTQCKNPPHSTNQIELYLVI